MTERAHELFEALKRGDRGALGRAITLVESSHPKDHADSMSLLLACGGVERSSVRIAVTGAPGVGKSSLIEHLGMELIGRGHRVAVLAVDPSSERSGGSILGDKTRMPELSRNPDAFIRPSPTSGVLGGVAEMTRETIMLCEAAGYDRILVETVGVGQSEFRVASLTDVVAFVTIAGSGDALQGIKRGILEVVNVVAVNKSDGSNEAASKQFAHELESALVLLHGHEKAPSLVLTSAAARTGLNTFLESIESCVRERIADASFAQRRLDQRETWFEQATTFGLHRAIRQAPAVARLHDELARQVKEGTIHPLAAADRLVAKLIPN